MIHLTQIMYVFMCISLSFATQHWTDEWDDPKHKMA